MFRELAAWYATHTAMALTNPDLGMIQGLFVASFDSTMAELRDRRPLAGFAGALAEDERDLVATYGIGNASAHGISRPVAAAVKFDRLVPRLFFAVFRATERLYP